MGIISQQTSPGCFLPCRNCLRGRLNAAGRRTCTRNFSTLWRKVKWSRRAERRRLSILFVIWHSELANHKFQYESSINWSFKIVQNHVHQFSFWRLQPPIFGQTKCDILLFSIYFEISWYLRYLFGDILWYPMIKSNIGSDITNQVGPPISQSHLRRLRWIKMNWCNTKPEFQGSS